MSLADNFEAAIEIATDAPTLEERLTGLTEVMDCWRSSESVLHGLSHPLSNEDDNVLGILFLFADFSGHITYISDTGITTLCTPEMFTKEQMIDLHNRGDITVNEYLQTTMCQVYAKNKIAKVGEKVAILVDTNRAH